MSITVTINQQPVLHHFEESPFAEKIRLAFGLKNISWASVIVSRIMPRPDLMPISGGYRRTPVLQIGADVYCDTQCILHELERRFPKPTLFPDGVTGLAASSAMWTDRSFFQNSVNLIFGMRADDIPESFVKDRQKLRDGNFDITGMKASVPQMRDQFRAHVSWIDKQLHDGRPWLCGDSTSLTDINAYMNVWYVRSNLSSDESLLEEFPRVRIWADLVSSIGHGFRTEISSQDALRIAAESKPVTTVESDALDPNGRKPGDRVSVTPDDYGKIAVDGEIVSLSAQHIALKRSNPTTGEIIIHFPKAGFLITAPLDER